MRHRNTGGAKQQEVQSMRVLFSKIAALVVALAISMTARANGVTDVSMEHQLTCLAQNIYHEAGNESFDGKVAVAQVTLNRALSGKFPNTICGVVNQKTVVANRATCQFSWVCLPREKVHYMSDAWEESKIVAQQVLYNNLRLDRLDDALYFHAVHVNPHWPLERVARIGNHVFYSNDRVIRKVAYNK